MVSGAIDDDMIPPVMVCADTALDDVFGGVIWYPYLCQVVPQLHITGHIVTSHPALVCPIVPSAIPE